MSLRPETVVRGSVGTCMDRGVQGCLGPQLGWERGEQGVSECLTLPQIPSPGSQTQAVCRNRRLPPATTICGVGNASRGGPSPHHPRPHPCCLPKTCLHGVRGPAIPRPGTISSLRIPAGPPRPRSGCGGGGVPIPTPSPSPRTPYPSAEGGEQAGEEKRGAHGEAGRNPAAQPRAFHRPRAKITAGLAE